MTIQAGQVVTVVYHDYSECTGMVGSRDNFTIELMSFDGRLREVPWATIRHIDVGNGEEYEYAVVPDDDDDPDDDDEVEEPEKPEEPPQVVLRTYPRFPGEYIPNVSSARDN